MPHGFAVGAVIAILLQGTAPAQAATCMDELDRFERRLHSSSLAATDPDRFEALLRQAEEAAELRDEEQCLQGVAELNAALPEEAGRQPASRSAAAPKEDARDNPRRPAAPSLMIANGADAGVTAADEKEPADAASAEGENDER